MMNKLIDIRQTVKNIYISKEPWITPVIKALVMLALVLSMNKNFGYNDTLTQWNIVLLIVLVASLLPWQGLTFISAVVFLLHMLSLSWEVALVSGVFILVIAIAQYIFLPGYSLAIVLIPLTFGIKLAYVVPLVLGLIGGTLCFIPAAAGTFLYYLIQGIEKNADAFGRSTGSASGALERFPQIISIIQDNDIMIISIIAFAAATVVVSVIRRISTDFSAYVAVAVGAITSIIIYLVGGFSSGIAIDYVWVFLGNIFAFMLAALSAFWLRAGDYGHAQYLQFEDEKYIYHVKAVPKLDVPNKDVKVHDISAKDDDDIEDKDIEDALRDLDALEAEERREES